MNKSFIHHVSVATLTLFFFSGCVMTNVSNEPEPIGDGNQSLEGQAINVLIPAGGIGQFNAWEARSKQFTKETGIEVVYHETPYENLMENIISEGISDSGFYDVVVFLDSMGPALHQFLQPLDSYVERDDFHVDRWPEAIVNLSTFEGTLYSLPIRAHVQMLFYREDLFNELNLEVPTTWDEFQEVSRIITEETDTYGIVPYYGAGNNGQNIPLWTAHLWSNGAELFDENLRPAFTTPEAIEATEAYVNLFSVDKVAPPGSVTFGEQDSRTSFRQGGGAMWIGWWWTYPEFNDPNMSAEEVAGNVSFASVPGWEGKSAQPSISTFPTAIMRSSEKRDAAWEFLQWLAEPEEELEIVQDHLTGESSPNQSSTVITQRDNLLNHELNDLTDGFYELAGENFERARALPTLTDWPRIADLLSSAISEMAAGAPVEESLNRVADRVEHLLERAGYYEEAMETKGEEGEASVE